MMLTFLIEYECRSLAFKLYERSNLSQHKPIYGKTGYYLRLKSHLNSLIKTSNSFPFYNPPVHEHPWEKCSLTNGVG